MRIASSFGIFRVCEIGVRIILNLQQLNISGGISGAEIVIFDNVLYNP